MTEIYAFMCYKKKKAAKVTEELQIGRDEKKKKREYGSQSFYVLSEYVIFQKINMIHEHSPWVFYETLLTSKLKKIIVIL